MIMKKKKKVITLGIVKVKGRKRGLQYKARVNGRLIHSPSISEVKGYLKRKGYTYKVKLPKKRRG